jgi:hypothetical protein
MEETNRSFTQARDKVAINRLTKKVDLRPIWSIIAIIVIWPFDRN